MEMLTIQFPDQTASQLKAVAQRLGITPEELIKLGVEEKLAKLREAFAESTDYVLHKNAELYKRLA